MNRKPRNRESLILAATLWVAMAVGCAVCDAAAKDNAARQEVDPLDRAVSVLQSRAPLGDSLRQLAEAQGIAIWLDRRVDPERRVSFAARDVPLGDVLAQVARDQGLGVCRLGSVVYFGPRETVARLRTLGELRREEARKLSPRGARRFLRAEPMEWEDLATPRELVRKLAEESQFRVEGLDRVVHDLWPAQLLPSLELVDRLTLILAPLDLTYAIEDGGARIRLVPIPERPALRRSYSVGYRPEDAGLGAEEVARRWRRLLPESRVTTEADRVVVEGRLEDHERLAASPRRVEGRPGRPENRSGAGIARVRIERVKFADQPLEPIVRRLAAQLGLELRFDAEGLRRSGVDLDRRVSVELENVTIDELLRALLEPAGLAFRRDGTVVEIRAAGAVEPD